MRRRAPIPMSLFYAFQLASGDNAPMHYDIEHCRSRGWPGLMAHGFQTLIQTAPGATGLAAEMEDALVGFLEQSSRFLKPVFSGDTLYPELEIVSLEPQRTTGVMTLASRVWNQRSELVLEGRVALPAAPEAAAGGGYRGGGRLDRRRWIPWRLRYAR